MKFEKYQNKIIVYIFDIKYIEEKIDKLIKIIFEILNKYYQYEEKESYDIKVYINKYYGLIIEIKETSKYLKYNIVNINMKILKDHLFLYEVGDPLNYIDNEIYYYKNKFYINMKKKDIRLIENTNIVFSEDVYKIIGKGIKI